MDTSNLSELLLAEALDADREILGMTMVGTGSVEVLKTMNIDTIEELIRHTEEELLSHNDFSRAQLKEIKSCLRYVSDTKLEFGMDVDSVLEDEYG